MSQHTDTRVHATEPQAAVPAATPADGRVVVGASSDRGRVGGHLGEELPGRWRLEPGRGRQVGSRRSGESDHRQHGDRSGRSSSRPRRRLPPGAREWRASRRGLLRVGAGRPLVVAGGQETLVSRRRHPSARGTSAADAALPDPLTRPLRRGPAGTRPTPRTACSVPHPESSFSSLADTPARTT
jgi:hypothetical protein